MRPGLPRLPASCGFTLAGEEDAPAGSRWRVRLHPLQSRAGLGACGTTGLLYAVGGSGRIYCFDVAAGALCPNDAAASLPDQLSATTLRFVFTSVAGELADLTHRPLRLRSLDAR